MNLQNEITAITPQVVEWRRQIHKYPELGLKEFRTAELVEGVLQSAGIEVVRYPESTAVVGILRGSKPGRTVALRADMDALPLTEETDLEFKSQIPGVMHACGHDVHTAILMGTAVILARKREQLAGNVKFFFQPAEEGPGGALPMIEAGCMKDPDVNMVFGLHVSTDLPAGQIGVTYGYSSANTDTARIKIIGKGGHGASPEKTADAVTIGAYVVNALQTIVSRNISALDSAVITVGSFHAGTVNNIIAETAELDLTVRSLKPEIRELLPERIEGIVKGVTQAMGADYEMEYIFEYPSTHNDERAVNLVRRVAEQVVGCDHIRVFREPSMGGEDFAYFAQQAPAAFFKLGAGFADRHNYPGHNPRFEVNEGCIPIGLDMMVRVALQAAQSDN